MFDKIAALGKLAAKKRRGSQSRLFKVKTKKDKKDIRDAMDEADGNAQSPHRYGRKKV